MGEVSEALSRDVIIQNYCVLVARHAELIRQQEKLIDNLTRLLTVALTPRLVQAHLELGRSRDGRGDQEGTEAAREGAGAPPVEARPGRAVPAATDEPVRD